MLKVFHFSTRWFSFGFVSLIVVVMATMLTRETPCARDAAVMDRLRDQLRQVPTGATVAVVVERADTGETIFTYNEHFPLKPASNQKILTSAAALFYLGADYRYQTDIQATGTVADGVLNGDLVVVGAGDPSISGRYQPDRTDATAIFRQWAEALKARGIQKIAGQIVGNDNAFDDVTAPEGWPANQMAEWYCAEVSALVFNDGCVDVHWLGGDVAGATPTYSLNPKTDYIQIVNQLKSSLTSNYRRYVRDGRPNTIICNGSVRARREAEDSIAVHGATRYFVHVLRSVLTSEGIEVVGPSADIDTLKGGEQLKSAARTLFTHESPPLATLLETMNGNSHNLFAETVFKTVARNEGGKGTFENGRAAVMRFLDKHLIDTEGLSIIDGSGLSYDNRLTARAIVSVLRIADNASWRDDYRNTFPVGGRTGSLKSRFQATSETRRLAGRIRAKTGYIRGARSLSGWVTRPDGSEYRFSILLNTNGKAISGPLAWIDKTALVLARD